MVVSDPIADMLTRIRNANQLRYKEIARILKEEGYIINYKIMKKDVQNELVLTLKYGAKKQRVITGLKRISKPGLRVYAHADEISKPGLRVYAHADEIPSVLNGLGIAIVSTSEGVMTGRDAKSKSLGGEVLAYVW